MRPELLASLLLLAGCSTKPGSAVHGEKPASVSHPISEGELTVVSLTKDAERRLALSTQKVTAFATHERKVVPGEIVMPSGGAVTLAAPFAATVRAVSDSVPIPRAGDLVHRKDKLLRLVPLAPTDRDVRAQAEKAVLLADTRHAAADQRVQRLEKLVGEGAASEKQLEEARAERASAAAELVAAKKRLAAIDASPLSADVSVTLEAPHDGVIRLSPVTAGQLVAAGTTVIEVVRKGVLWVRATTFAGDAPRVLADSPAGVVGLGAVGVGFEVSPVAAPPSADPAAATVDLFYELPASASYRPGERVRVTLDLGGTTNARAIALSAVIYDAGGGTWVYQKVADGRFTRRRVDVARVEGGSAVLAQGPDVGAELVTTGAAQLFGVEFGAGH